MPERDPNPEPSPSAPGRAHGSGQSSRWWRAGRRVLKVAGMATIVVGSSLLVLLALLQLDPVATGAARAAAGWLSSDSLAVRVQGASGSWIGGLELTRVHVRSGPRDDPAWTVSADTVSADYRLIPLLRRRIELSRVRVTGVEATVASGGRSSTEGDEAGTPGPGWTVSVDRVAIDVRRLDLDTSDGEPWSLSDGRLRANGLSTADGLRATLDTLNATFRPPGRPAGWGRVAAAGSLDGGRVRIAHLSLTSPESEVRATGAVPVSLEGTAPEGLDLDLTAAPLLLADVSPFLPASIADSLRVRAGASLRTAADTLLIRLEAEADVPGRLTLDARVQGPRSEPDVDGTLTLASLDLRAWGFSDRELRVDADVVADLASVTRTGTHGFIDVDGRVAEPDGTTLASVGLEARADEDGAPWRGSWRAEGLGGEGEGTLQVVAEEIPAWALSGDVRYANASRVAGAAGTFDAEGRGLGESLDATLRMAIDSLAMVSDSSHAPVVVGPGRLDARLEAGREVTAALGLDAGGGRITLEVEGDLDARTGRLLRGTARGVDVAALVGDTVPSVLAADLTGSLGSLDPLRASATARVTTARYGALTLDSARLEAEAEGAEYRLVLAAAAPDSGRLAGSAQVTWREESRRVRVDSLSWSALDLRALVRSADSSAMPRTSLSGSARGEVVRAGDAWIGNAVTGLSASTVGGAPIDTAHVRVDLDEAGADLDLGMLAGDARVVGRGRVALEDVPRFTLAELELREVDLAALVPGAAPVTRLTGRVEAEWTGTGLGTGTGRLLVALQDSRVASTAFDTLRLEADADEGVVRATARIGALGGTMSVEADARVGSEPRSYAVSGLVVRPDTAGDGHALYGRFGLEGEGTRPESATVGAWIEVDSARWAGRAVDAARLTASLADAEVVLDTLELSAPGVSVAGGGSLPVSAPGNAAEDAGDPDADGIRLTASLENPRLLEAMPVEGPVGLGSARLDVTVGGAVDDLRIESSGSADALLFGTTTVEAVTFEGSVHRMEDQGWVAGTGRLDVERIRTPRAPIERLAVEAELTEDDELVVVASSVVDDERDLSVTARIAQVSHALGPSSVTLEALTLRMDPDEWSLAAPTEVTIREGVRFDGLRLGSESGTLRIDGGIPSDGPLDLEARLEGLELAGVADLFGFPRVRGRMDGFLTLGGTREQPTLHARLDGRFRPRDASPGTLGAEVVYEADSAAVDASITLDGGAGITADATVPYRFGSDDEGGLRDDAPIRADVAVDSFPLAWLGPFLPLGVVREPEGRLDGTVEVGGTPGSPALGGALALTGGAADLPALGVRYSGVVAALRLHETTIVVDSLRVRSDGTLSVDGTVEVASLDEPAYDVRVRADGFEAVRSSAVNATVSGDVTVSGRGLAPTVSGVVSVERADLYLGELVATEDVAQVTLTDDQWDELARVFGYRRSSEQAGGAPLFEQATLDLEVELGRASWVRQRASPELALQFSGQMSIQKERGDSLQLVGSVESVPDRSWVEQFGRRFSITEGTLTFQGAPSATRVDVTAAYEVPSRDNPGEPEVVLTLGVTGTPRDLSLELSSTPPLEASDMVSYLVTGRPAGQSLAGGGNGSLTDAGGALALGRLSSAVETYAREEVGLDVFELTTDGVEGMMLVAGRYLSPELYLGIRRPVSRQRSAGDPAQRAPTSELEVELQAARWLLLNLRAGGRGGVEFYVRSRIAYE